MSLVPLIAGDLAPGRYRFAGPQRISALRAEADVAGWATGVVDGRAMPDRRGLFGEFAAALRFPDWFGGNWDAFADCLQDLSWLPATGYVVLWRHASAADSELRRRSEEIIDTAIEARVSMRLPPLYVIYAGPRRGFTSGAASRLRSAD